MVYYVFGVICGFVFKFCIWKEFWSLDVFNGELEWWFIVGWLIDYNFIKCYIKYMYFCFVVLFF